MEDLKSLAGGARDASLLSRETTEALGLYQRALDLDSNKMGSSVHDKLQPVHPEGLPSLGTRAAIFDVVRIVAVENDIARLVIRTTDRPGAT
ncbi:hypothetical protein C8046_16735 [Serinibacter arcticus]|uniref:Uncharacterized protein n=1 Tax=Serinibacter arcticus TaxID=1655435 RepID=A0A2U1ZYH6_9MICO|nr:hypothetical protein [Serinibacter arcticus]PWD52045.1 hypothetical protein C8046_16735 [Serinibacter arcticus]